MIFADTVYFLGLLNAADQWHRQAARLTKSLKRPLVTSSWVLLETGNSLHAPPWRIVFATFLSRLRRAGDLEIVPATQEWFDRGTRLFEARPDKEWSLTDCISFLIMEEKKIHEALTSDHHFEQAGFVALLKPD